MESLLFAKVMPDCRVFLQDGRKITEGLICPHCKLVLNDPVQTIETGLRFCRECFLSTPAGVDPNEEAWSDVAVRNEIANLSVMCQNKMTGCEWMGLFKEYNVHITTCERTHKPRDNYIQPTSFTDSDPERSKANEELMVIDDGVLQACGPTEHVVLASNHNNQAQSHPPLGKDGFKEYTTAKFDGLEKRTGSVEKRTDKMENKIEDIQKTLADIGGFYSGYINWRIPEVSKLMNNAVTGGLYSPPFYTKRDGYKMCLVAHLNGDGAGKRTHLSIYFAIMRGEYDPVLNWPFMAKVTITLLNQDHSKNYVRSFIPDPNLGHVKMPTTSLMNDSTGFSRFIERSSFLNKRKASYVKSDVMYITAVVDTSITGH